MKSALLVALLVIRIKSDAVSLKYEKPRLEFSPCVGQDIKTIYNYGSLPAGKENQYIVSIPLLVARNDEIILVIEVDSKAQITLIDEPTILLNTSRVLISTTPTVSEVFTFNFVNTYDIRIKLAIEGLNAGTIPYIRSLIINDVEYCETPVVGYLNRIVQDYRIATQVLHEMLSVSVNKCGRRKLDFNELIVKGTSARHGDWPWHVAIYRRSVYICGGTLITKLFVLTAAHCVTNPVKKVALSPYSLMVNLGKHNYYQNDDTTQMREIFSVTVHEKYGNPRPLDNDIALLKLNTEAVYTDYVQPACLWSAKTYRQTPSTIGTVVGWGTSETTGFVFSSNLNQISMPILTQERCLQKDVFFYGNFLSDGKKFCAGWGKGSSPCNGDSGGGFMIFVPDDTSTTQGAWYIRGIVSVGKKQPTSNICDPNYYTVFTDTLSHENWILNKTLCSCFPPLARKLCSDTDSFTNMKSIDSC